MNFENMLFLAQRGSKSAIEDILTLYRPLLIKESIHQGVFDEDLYQELCMTLLNCTRNFHI